MKMSIFDFRKFQKNKIIIGIVILIAVFLSGALALRLYFNVKPLIFPDYLKKMGVELKNSNDFILKDKAEEKNNDLINTTLIAENGKTILRLERLKPLSQDAAERKKVDRLQILQALFLPFPSPYSEFVTNQTECPEEFWPITEDSVWQLYASERLTYGVCSRDLIKFNSALKLEYCPKQKALYQIEIFTPYDKNSGLKASPYIKNIINSFQCK